MFEEKNYRSIQARVCEYSGDPGDEISAERRSERPGERRPGLSPDALQCRCVAVQPRGAATLRPAHVEKPGLRRFRLDFAAEPS